MLVLSRSPGEEVVIGEDIRLTVVAIRGNQVRLGVTAPPDVLIRREKLCEKTEDRGASALDPATLEAEP
jgi:carbon storage regulator